MGSPGSPKGRKGPMPAATKSGRLLSSTLKYSTSSSARAKARPSAKKQRPPNMEREVTGRICPICSRRYVRKLTETAMETCYLPREPAGGPASFVRIPHADQHPRRPAPCREGSPPQAAGGGLG